METSSGGTKAKKRLFRNPFKRFQSPLARVVNANQSLPSVAPSAGQSDVHEARSGIDSPSASRSNVQEHEVGSPSTIQSNTQTEVIASASPSTIQSNTNSLVVASPSAVQSNANEGLEIASPRTGQSSRKEGPGAIESLDSRSNVKEGLGIAIRFAQTLVKKLPECVDISSPPKMALSIIKTIIDIKNDIGDNKDILAECLQETRSLLGDVVGRILAVPDSDAVNQEVDKYKKKIEVETTNIFELTEKLNSNIFQNLDYENYKKKMEDVSKRINNATRSFTVDLQITIAKMTSQIHEEQKKASLKDLKPSKKADHRTIFAGQSLKREVCTEGTRVTILEDITNWANDHMESSPRVFWLTGQAGSGKTTIAYTIAKQFEKGQPTVLAANFLCSRQFEETRNLNRVLPTIAYQLAFKCRPYERELHTHVTDKSAIADHDFSEQMQELLVGPWCNIKLPSDLPTYLVVIDALDEINEDGGPRLLGVLLTTISQQHLSGLKFLVTSRTDRRIVDLCATFESKAVCRLQDVPIEDAEADVEKYLDIKLPNIVGSPEVAELRQKASGLFIYAATVVRILTTSRSITQKEQMRKLKNLLSKPTSLSSIGKDKSPIDGLYEQILYEAFSNFTDEEDLVPRLRILFTFLCAAERISTSVAATLMGDDDELARAVLNDLHAVLYIQDGRVFWYHASFLDFLFTQNRSTFRIGDTEFTFWCNKAVQHNLIALSCLRVMNSEVHGLQFNMGDIPSSYLLDAEHLDDLSEHVNKNITPVQRYSSFHWARHLSSTVANQNIDNICSDISDFLKICVLFWIEAMNLLGSSNQCTPMLYLARQWVLKSNCTAGTKSALARDLLESANFATYFTGSPAAESTPHLYISSLATWIPQSSLSQNWKIQFSRIPAFTHSAAANSLPLMTIHVPKPRVYAVAISNEGTRIASGTDDAYVRIWDASTGKEVKILEGHTGGVLSVAFSSDDKWIVSGSYDNSVRAWDVLTGSCLKLMKGHTGNVNSVAFSKTGLQIISASCDQSIHLWDVSTGDVLMVIMGHTKSVVNSVAISGDGTWITSGSGDRSVRVWDASTGEELRAMEGHTEVVTSVAISVDGTRIVSGSEDASVRVWDSATGEELRVMEGHRSTVTSVAFSSNGAWIVSGSYDFSVRVWDASSGEVLKVLNGHDRIVRSVAFSSDATRVVSGSDDGSVRVWNVSITQLDEVNDGTNLVTSVAFSNDGTRVLSGSSDGSVHVWDTATRQELKVLREGIHLVTSVASSNAGTHIAWGSESKLWVWGLSGNAEGMVLEGHTGYVSSISFSRDGNLIVSGSDDHTLRLWDVSTGAELKVMHGHTDKVNSVSFSQDGKKIVSGSCDDFVRVWDVSTGDSLKVIRGYCHWVLSVAFSNDAAQIVTGSDIGVVIVWDASAGRQLKVLQGHTNPVGSVMFSSNDAHIVSGSYGGTVRTWDSLTGEEIHTLQGCHTNCVCSVAFSSDGRSIISGSTDGSVINWGLDEPIWQLVESNWILSLPTNDRLMWVPPDAQVLKRSNCRILIGESTYSSVYFEKSMQPIGPAWQECYTPTSHLIGPDISPLTSSSSIPPYARPKSSSRGGGIHSEPTVTSLGKRSGQGLRQ